MTRTFSPSEAALSVFELAKRQPQFVLRFCIIYALFVMLTFGLGGALGIGTVLTNYLALIANGKQPDPEALLAVLSPATGAITILLIVGVLSGVLTSTMGLRKAVRDEDTGLLGLQIGGDELRLFAAMLMVGAVLMAVNILVSIVGAVVTLGNAQLMGLTVVASLIGMAILGVRLSQFGVLTIASRAISVAPS
jgi:hypothetical protein